MNKGMSKVIDMLMYDILDYIRHHPQVTRHELIEVFKVHEARIIRRTQYLEANDWIESCWQDGRKGYTATDKLFVKPVEIQTVPKRPVKPRKTSSKPHKVSPRETEDTREPSNEITLSVIHSNGRYRVEVYQCGTLTHSRTFDQYDDAIAVLNRVWNGEPLGKLEFQPADTTIGGKVVTEVSFTRFCPLVME